VDKVTAFVVRQGGAGRELLILQHPFAGLQLPAGTVEPGETPEAGALREAQEETGLVALEIVRRLDVVETDLRPRGLAILRRTQTVYSRPDPSSFDWAAIRSGLWVDVLREQEGWAHVRFTEWDVWPNPNYASYEITGWLPADAVSRVERRSFYLLRLTAPAPERWTAQSDQHTFTLFWAPLASLPELVTGQQQWLDRFRAELEDDA
jgi:8-oxo-dGTP pyrophosphatase MutT (NUDIX family)